MSGFLTIALLAAALPGAPIAPRAAQAESLWIEAEHLDGIRGHCWPMGRDEMKKTRGHWGLSGPGWAAEWNQGGESGFLSIATGADDDKAVASKALEVPVDGRYFVWVRYGDWREQAEPFEVRIDQAGRKTWTGQFGRKAVVEEDNVMKLYWDWAFAWDKREAQLRKGPARLALASTRKAPQPRQIDVIVLTTDSAYRPRIKDRPRNHAWGVLETYRQGVPGDLEPLARNRPRFALAETWRLRTSATPSPRRAGWATPPPASRCPTTSSTRRRGRPSRRNTPAAIACRSSPIRGSCPRSTASARASSPPTRRRVRCSRPGGASPSGSTSTLGAAGP